MRDSPRVHAKEPRPINTFEVESASIDTAHDERRPGGGGPFERTCTVAPGGATVGRAGKMKDGEHRGWASRVEEIPEGVHAMRG